MRETWYVLEDGNAVHPSEVSVNEDGRLAHKSGLVEMRGDTPRSRGVEVDEARVVATPAPAAPPKRTTEMRPAPAPKPQAKKPGYKTRKAR